ncbi:EF-hand domain-containing protein [Naegleria gruberi]|uniref:EF-hand domain-containing protein n=1 Tax=Naegleria gruberi TaxID=5762 RepID=D2VRQ5_NAEGR|nr:EF-hand domain-containing protein [Naegleria gruberi]EFC40504.1 EF-hand domain-containing protein [Naegleria gruberi]|eukprot:XP_002673248.1 EF-hand domain-containing protein [Naegleria gruberi strain NEG-M]
MSSHPTPTSPQNSTKRISFIDNAPSTPTRKGSKSIDSPLNNIVASRSRAKSSPIPPQNLTPTIKTPSSNRMTSPISKGPLDFSSGLTSPSSPSNASGGGQSISNTRRLSISTGVVNSPNQQKKEGRRERLSMVFRLFDKDGDDKLNPEEMNDFLTSVYNGPESKEFLSLIKNSHKEGVTFDEFVKLCRDDAAAASNKRESKSPMKGRGRSQSMAISAYKHSPLSEIDDDDGFTDEDLRAVFSEILDVNEDGVVSMSEFKKVISNLGIQQTFSDEELSILFEGSKTLSFDQFRKLVM